MSLANDAELRELFTQEMTERVAALVAGAQAMVDGKLTDEIAGTMFREGHTVKGTARVMGFEAISRAGVDLESWWRKVHQQECEGSETLGTLLGALAAAVPGAVEADPDEGSGQLIAALSRMARYNSGDHDPDPAVAPAPEIADEGTDTGGSTLSPSDLGGLLSALDTWAAEESARVNAANLYRLINSVAAVDVETKGLRGMLLELSDTVPRDSETRVMIDEFALAVEAVERSVRSSRDQALELASVELKQVSNTYPQLIRYLARKVGKEIRFEIVGDESSVDRQVLERLSDPMRQLLVNAIEHGIESPDERVDAGKSPTATIAIHASVKDHRMEVVIEDDGRGVDWGAVHRTAMRRGLLPASEVPDAEALRSLLFAPGFSTALSESELVGDGSGLTLVAEAIESLHGSFVFETEPGKGTKVTLAVPTSRALQDAILVGAAGQEWGIPEIAIVGQVHLDDDVIHRGPNHNELTWNDQRIPVVTFAAAVGLVERDAATEALIIASPVGSVALTVPRVIGQQQVAAKELGPLIGGAPHLTGAALLGGGKVVVLVDPSRLAERARALPAEVASRPMVMVVDDSQGARQVVAATLASSGFETCTAGGVAEALELLAEVTVDALVVDFSMPDSDGIELVGLVRERFGSVPIVMLSGVATPEDQVRARRSGVDAYFDKADFREGALAATLEDLVKSDANRLQEAS